MKGYVAWSAACLVGLAFIAHTRLPAQGQVKSIADKIDLLLVVGAPNSSNSKRLVEVGVKSGCPRGELVQRATDLDWPSLQGLKIIGLTAGASAPEVLVNEIIDAFRMHYDVTVDLDRVVIDKVARIADVHGEVSGRIDLSRLARLGVLLSPIWTYTP